MKTRYAREIRKGLLVARDEARARREDDVELTVKALWALLDLEGLSRRAFDRSWRKTWPRFR